jgi:hypothetical protein
LVNPFLYSYFNMRIAAWNNVSIGAIVLALAMYQDFIDAHARDWQQRQRRMH